jgi:thiamine transport system permease protein
MIKRVLLWIAPLVFLGTFYLFPLVSILKVSLERGHSGVIAPFIEVFSSVPMVRIIGFTFWQATLSTLLTIIVGLPGAYLLARYRFPGKGLFRALTGVPFILPTLVTAMAFDSLFGVRGWVNTGLMTLFQLEDAPFQFSYTLGAILLAHVFYNTTIVLRVVGDFWSRLDPRFFGAARVLGATRFQTLRYITLPILMPAITTAALLVFIFDFTSCGVSLVLGGPRFATLETEIYYQTTAMFNLPIAAVLSILQLAFTLGMTLLYTRLTANLARPLSLRSLRIIQRPLSTWHKRIMAALILGTLLMLLFLPLFSLATRSFVRLGGDRGQIGSPQIGLTWDFYRQLVVFEKQSLFAVSPITAIFISMGYALMTVILSLFLGLPVAWALAKNGSTKGREYARCSISFSRLVEAFLLLPLGTSAVTMGLGFVVAFNHPPLLLVSPILIPMAHTLVAFPFVVRSLVPALQSIQPRMRQAAAILGASPGQVFRNVDLPLIGRTMLVAAIFALSISLGEFGATSLLTRPEYPTMPVAIYRYLSRPGAMNYGQALALSTILMLICMLGMVVIERFRVSGVGEF